MPVDTALPASGADTAARASEQLRAGNLAVVPTDTVYALVAHAFDPDATRRLLRVRGAGRNRPLTILIRSERQVVGLAGDLSEHAERLAAAYWPGPLTLVVRAGQGLSWDLGNTSGTVAVRIPTDDLLQRVIGEVGPLASSGAHLRGKPVATTVADAADQLGDAVACYVDGGVRGGPPSTIVDATGQDRVDVVREGAIPTEHIRAVAAGELDWGARPDSGTTED